MFSAFTSYNKNGMGADPPWLGSVSPNQNNNMCVWEIIQTTQNDKLIGKWKHADLPPPLFLEVG